MQSRDDGNQSESKLKTRGKMVEDGEDRQSE
jgi:hypothetical protein